MEPLTLAGALASIGLPAAVTYFVARSGNKRVLLRRALWISVPISIATYGILVAYSTAVSSKQGIPIWILWSLWSTIIISAIVQILRGYWQGIGSWKRLDAERFSFAILRFLAIVAIAALGFTHAGTFAAGALSAFIVAGLILIPSKAGDASQDLDTPSHKKFLRYSVATALGTIAVVGNNRLDQVILPAVTASSEVGYYAVAVTVAEVPVIFATLAARNALTRTSEGHQLRRIWTDSRPFIVVGIMAALILMITAPLYTTLLFGADFSDSVMPIQILACGTIFSMMTFISISVVSGRGMPGRSSIIPMAGLLTTGAGFLLIGADMNSVYASVISTASQLVAAIVGTVLVFRTPQGPAMDDRSVSTAHRH